MHPFDLSRLDNQPQITEAIRSVLKEDYNFDSTVCHPNNLPEPLNSDSPAITELFLCIIPIIYRMCLRRRRGWYSILQNR